MIKSYKPSAASQAAPLLQMLKQAGTVSRALERFVIARSVPLRIKKGTLLLTEGDVCTHIYFIRTGLVRGFIKEGRTDITTWITAENEMAASIRSFVLQQKAFDCMQALEDCELLAISHADMEFAYKKFPCFNAIARKIYENYYVDAENRALLIRLKNAEAKYKNLLQKQPDLVNRIPLKYIASYLGITLETLSRVRKRLSQALVY